MLDKILIVYSEKLTNKHLETLRKVREIVGGRNVLIVKSQDLQKSCFEDIKLAITIGGDGTFIRTASYISDELILGINSEPEYSEGALTSLRENQLGFLEKILKGEFKIIKRERARVIRNKVVLDELALNEVYVGAYSQFHTSRYAIKFKEKEEEQRSSGVLIATGSGSKAWYKSAGGTPFPYDERKLKFIVREPYFGDHIFKPTIFTGEILEGGSIEIISKRHDGGIIAIDANSILDFNIPDKVEIELSDKPLNVIKLK